MRFSFSGFCLGDAQKKAKGKLSTVWAGWDGAIGRFEEDREKSGREIEKKMINSETEIVFLDAIWFKKPINAAGNQLQTFH